MHIESVAREWLVARNCIADYLQRVGMAPTRDLAERHAAAIIADLAARQPPILLETCDEPT